MVVLETERLVLREVAENDWPAVHAYAIDPLVSQFMLWGPNTEQETRDFVSQAIASQQEVPRQRYELAIVLQSSGQLVGTAGIGVTAPEHREGSIGYCLNRPMWGYGYATEAARRLLAFGFDKLDLHRVWATCDPQNLGSAHVLEKIGMRREGHLREHLWQKGKWRDSYVYAILEHEWR
jgi:ribosomal-protein-alanine N-acetyltransferase